MDLLKLLFRGRQLSETDTVEEAGIKDGAKVHVIPPRPAPVETQSEPAAPSDPLAKIEKDVEAIESQVAVLKSSASGSPSNPKPAVLNELLTQALLSLDNLDVTGDVRVRRKTLINRIHALCSELDQIDQKSREPQREGVSE